MRECLNHSIKANINPLIILYSTVYTIDCISYYMYLLYNTYVYIYIGTAAYKNITSHERWILKRNDCDDHYYTFIPHVKPSSVYIL